MRTQRHGFTLTELSMTLSIFGLAAILVGPRLSEARSASHMTSAKQSVAALAATTRAAAIQRGRPAKMMRHGTRMWATVENNGTHVRITPVVDFRNRYGIHFSTDEANRDSIIYSPRGVATNLTGRWVYELRRAGVRDSVCLSRRGTVAPGGCEI